MVTIKRTKRRLGISCRVLIGGDIEVKAGYAVTGEEIESFLMHHKRWLATHIAKAENKAKFRDRYSDGSLVLLHGKDVSVTYIRGIGESHYDGDSVTIYYEEDKETALHMWYMRYASEYLERMFHSVAGDVCRVVVRYTKTYYGICYSRPNGGSYISLNARLIGATDDLIRYVIHHEVAHLSVPNHSKRFYEVLSKSEPTHRELARRLRDSVLIVE